MRALEQALGGPAIEVVTKATRRRFTLEYKRKIVREVDGCKTPGAVGALLRREGLYFSHLATWRAARDRGDLLGVRKKRGPAPRVTDSRDRVIAEQAREIMRWKHRAERAEALVEVQKKWRRCWGPRWTSSDRDGNGDRGRAPVPVRNLIGQCRGGSTLGSIVHGPRQHLRDEDVKGRKGRRPQTRPWRERAKEGSRSR
jgi:transposase